MARLLESMQSQSTKRDFPFLMVIVLLHLLLAGTYALIIPYRTPGTLADGPHVDIGAPDENAHANYVAHVIRGELPALKPTAEENGQDYEVHQPPLFYAIEAAVIDVMGLHETESHRSGTSMRFVNVLFGAATVVGVFYFCLWANADRKLALVAAGIVALLPMFCAVSGTINNDALLACLSTWMAALCVKSYEGWTWRNALLIGLFAGLALWTKATALVLLPVIVIAFLYSQTERRKLWLPAIALAVPIILILPWWIRNAQIYHDPLALGVFQQAFKPTVTLEQLNASGGHALVHWGYVLLGGSLYSFVGEFGYMDINFPKWVYIPSLAVLLIGLLAGMFWKSKGTSAKGTGTWLFVFTLAAFIQFNLNYVQPQARYLFPAVAVIGFWVALGMRRVLKERAIPIGVAFLVWLLLINGYAFTTLPREFAAREAPRPTPLY